MTVFDGMNADQLANIVEACHVLLEEPGAGRILSERALSELQATRAAGMTALVDCITAIRDPHELEMLWHLTEPDREDDNLWWPDSN